MKDGSRCRRKKLEKISLEELMGAAGMSGFGALLEPPPVREPAGWHPPVELRLRFSLVRAAMAEKVERQGELLRSLREPLAKRARSMEQVLEILSWIHRVSAADPASTACAAAVPPPDSVVAAAYSAVAQPW